MTRSHGLSADQSGCIFRLTNQNKVQQSACRRSLQWGQNVTLTLPAYQLLHHRMWHHRMWHHRIWHHSAVVGKPCNFHVHASRLSCFSFKIKAWIWCPGLRFLIGNSDEHTWLLLKSAHADKNITSCLNWSWMMFGLNNDELKWKNWWVWCLLTLWGLLLSTGGQSSSTTV